MSGRGYSHRLNEGQAWKNADGTFGGWLNVDGHQRRVSVVRLHDGSLGLTVGKPRTEEHRDVPPVDYAVEPQAPADTKARRHAEWIVRSYGRRK